MRYRVVIEQDEDGVFVAECPTLPGCVSQGATRDEAVVNIKDAIEGYIGSLEKHGEELGLDLDESAKADLRAARRDLKKSNAALRRNTARGTQ